MEVVDENGKTHTRKTARTPVMGRYLLLALVQLASQLPTVSAQETAGSGFVVQGVDGPELANVQAFLGLLNAEPEDLEDSSMYHYLEQSAREEIELALEPFGYYHPTVELHAGSDGAPTQIIIDKGRPTLITSVSIEFTNSDFGPERIEQLRDHLGLDEGQRFNHTTYEDGKKEITASLSGRGRLKAKLIEHRVLVDRDLNTAQIFLTWDVGPRHYFGQIEFSGTQFDDAFMARYVNLNEGDRYDKGELLKLSQNLMDSPYFRTAEVLPRLAETSEDFHVPLRIRITPMPLYLFEAGVSIGTDTGGALEGLYERRWVNRKGHWIRTRLAPGTDLSTFNFTYNIPHARRLDRAFAISVGAVDEITNSNRKKNFSVSLAQQSLWGRWRRAEAIRYLDERFVVGAEPGESILLLLQGGLSRSKPSKVMIPESGWSLAAAYKIASDSFVSDTSMLQLDFQGKGIFSFGEKNRLISRAHIGVTLVDDFDKLPVSLRYFAGGNLDATITDLEQVTASLSIQSGENRIQVEVPQWPGKVASIDLSIIDLGAFIPGLAGHTTATAAVTQHPEGLVIDADLNGADIIYDAWTLDGLTANAAVDLRPGQSSQVRLDLGPVTGPVEIQSTRLELSGQDKAFEFAGEIQSQFGVSTIAATIDLNGNPKLAVGQLNLDTHDLGHWKLAAPLVLEFAPDAILMAEPTCLGADETRICVGLPGADGSPGQLRLESFPFSLIDRLIIAAAGQAISLDGILNGDFQYHLKDEQPVIKGFLSNDGLKVTLGSEQDQQSFELTDWRLELDGERDLEIDFVLNTREGSVSAIGKVTQWADPETARLFIELGVEAGEDTRTGVGYRIETDRFSHFWSADQAQETGEAPADGDP